MQMEKAEKDKLERFLNSYFKEIHKIYVAEDFTEGSFYSTLGVLVEQCSPIFISEGKATVLAQPEKTEIGIPDFLIKRDGEIVGHIEAKLPSANLDDEEKKEQLQKYRESLPNLILTNFLEFRLYRNYDLIDKVEVGRQSTLLDLKYPPVPEKSDLFWELLDEFFRFSTPEMKTSASLSVELAKRTRLLKDVLQGELSKKNQEVTRFYRAFQEELIETLTKERFADLYAQTITYGLFAARMKVQDKFNKDIAWKSIPESLPLLKEIFYSFIGPNFPESLRWVVDDISQVLNKADITSISKEFKTTKWEEDPVINFYETFLKTYNPEERRRLGVYYTPLPVVSYITTSIHKLLKAKFRKAEGLATNDVTLLDPAAGTLTFIVQAIKQVQKELEERNKAGLITAYIEKHILPDFHAFEILVAPYTVGHFKVSMVLEEMGYKFKEGERFQFYLTNTLEMKEPKQISFLINLAKEGQEAKRIKEKVPILVILGNPPYSFRSVKTKFSDELLQDYKEDVRTEKKYGVLEDDYIKFIRFAHWKIEQSGKGILGFITNNSYLSGVIHRGMRRKLLETFDEIYILNLHGSSRVNEKLPVGVEKDKNVFAIQQGVAIAIYVKTEEPQKEKKVYYADLWGLQNEKYDYLLTNDVETTRKQNRWQELEPVAPWYFFVPMDFRLQKEYDNCWKITQIFQEWGSGIITRRDDLAVAFQRDKLQEKMFMFTNSALPDSIIAKTFRGRDTSEWNLHTARERVKNEKIQELIREYRYRPWDFRHIYYSDSIVSRTCKRWMRHLLKPNVAIALMRTPMPWEKLTQVLVVDSIADMNFYGFQTYFFPLYRYSDEAEGQMFGEQECIPNFTDKFLQAIKESLEAEPTPEEIFYYVYAVLYSHTYRQRYEEFLKIDFPSIPLPTDYKAFKALSNLGKELVDLHLLKHPALEQSEVGFPREGSYKVDNIRYKEGEQRVDINKDQYFEGVSKEVWEYRIGADQVMEKYLKDRKGRQLPLSMDEINHYMKVAKAIRLTIGLQGKIDEAYLKMAIIS
jgi:type I restriction-modification system DNA methylase subunit